MVFSSIFFKPQKVWGSIVNLPLFQFSASCHAQFTLWARQHIGVIFREWSQITSQVFIVFSNQTWYQVASIHHCSVYQISRQSDNPFPPYGNFHTKTKRKKKQEKNKETKPVFESLHLGNAWLKFGMWGTDSGEHLHSKNCLVLYKQHKVTYTRKLHYCSSCQYTHWCCVPAPWAARHTTVCLNWYKFLII